MSKICNLECDAFCDAGDEEKCPRYKEYRDELLKNCIAVYEQKIRSEAIDDIVDRLHHLWNNLYAHEFVSVCEVFHALDIVRAEQLKEQKNG